MLLEDFGCLLINNLRSRAYIQKLVRNSFFPKFVVYLELQNRPKKEKDSGPLPVIELINKAFKERKYFLYDPALKDSSLLNSSHSEPLRCDFFDLEEPVIDTVVKNNLDYQTVQTSNINDAQVINVLTRCRPKYFLFGGGGILKKPLLNSGKKFIHIHPGRLPFFRGSHCIEWSILLGEKCTATAFLMNDTIDGGDIITQMEFDFPKFENGGISPIYSSHIRSELLIKVIKDYLGNGRFVCKKQDLSAGETYYKMHPAITNLVFNKLISVK